MNSAFSGSETAENTYSGDFKSASIDIFNDLKARIISGEYLPGDRLPSERKLIDSYHRSRPTIREALRMLDRAGFIKTMPRRAAVVLEYTGSGIEKPINEAIEASFISLPEIKEFRAVLEGAVAAWAAERRTDEDIRRIHNSLIRMRESVNDYETFLQQDADFHMQVAKACKNRTCEIMLASISDISHNFTRENLAGKSVRQRKLRCLSIYELHQTIYEKIRNGDPEGAREAMLFHLAAFEKELSVNTNITNR